MKERLEDGFIRLVTLQALDSELAQIESGKSRNSWKKLLVVAPPRDAFAVLLGRRWLPEEISVLSDREFVDRIKDGKNAVANPHFADFRYRDLSTGLIFDHDQIAEIVMRVREKLAS